MNAAFERNNYLNWFEDECFFSLCSRQHIFWAKDSPQETLASLFGHGIHSYSHDFPRNLDSLNLNAVTAWGSAEEIIDQHTIAPMFFPFQSREHAIAHKEAMRGNNLGTIKYKLGLITGRFGGEHPLKACSECIIADRRTHGVAYWHLSHQFPGVTTCPTHDRLLRESKENRQWSKAFSWFIPSESILIEDEPLGIDESAFEALKDITNAATKLGKLGLTTSFESALVTQVYKAALARLGTSRREKAVAAEDFAHHCSTLRKHPQFSSLPSSSLCAIAFTSQMTRKPRGYCHPLKHLVLISWLFQSIESFVSDYQHQARLRENAKVNEPREVKQLEAKQWTTAKVVTPPTVLKPKKIFKEVKENILDSLSSGRSKVEVCTSFGISISTVNRILRLNPIIEERRNETIKLKKDDQYRTQWCLTVANNPGLSTKKIRKLIPNIYSWLYRNDKIWLSVQTTSLPIGRNGNNSNTDWASRDEELCTKINDVLTQRVSNTMQLRKYDVYQLVPGLYSALESKKHYHKTRALLSEVTKPPVHGIPL